MVPILENWRIYGNTRSWRAPDGAKYEFGPAWGSDVRRPRYLLTFHTTRGHMSLVDRRGHSVRYPIPTGSDVFFDAQEEAVAAARTHEYARLDAEERGMHIGDIVRPSRRYRLSRGARAAGFRRPIRGVVYQIDQPGWVRVRWADGGETWAQEYEFEKIEEGDRLGETPAGRAVACGVSADTLAAHLRAAVARGEANRRVGYVRESAFDSYARIRGYADAAEAAGVDLQLIGRAEREARAIREGASKPCAPAKRGWFGAAPRGAGA